jgi:hypothetical protein
MGDEIVLQRPLDTKQVLDWAQQRLASRVAAVPNPLGKALADLLSGCDACHMMRCPALSDGTQFAIPSLDDWLFNDCIHAMHLLHSV